MYFDDRTMAVPKTTMKNRIIENIISDGDIIMKN